MTTTVAPNPNHPAKFTPEVLTQIRAVVRAEARRIGRPPSVLDPFAGVGRIHELVPDADTYGLELEPEWAACHPRTRCGDALNPPPEFLGWFDIVATSVTYGNRMADHHNAGDACTHTIRPLGKPERVYELADCPKCKGSGLSPRKSYKTSLGRMPSDGSSCVMQWKPIGQHCEYRDFHKRWIGVALECLDDGGLLIVNVKNHTRDRKLQLVVEWWLSTLIEFGVLVEAVLPVPVRGMRHGANFDQRSTVEQIIVVRKPIALEAP